MRGVASEVGTRRESVHAGSVAASMPPDGHAPGDATALPLLATADRQAMVSETRRVLGFAQSMPSATVHMIRADPWLALGAWAVGRCLPDVFHGHCGRRLLRKAAGAILCVQDALPVLLVVSAARGAQFSWRRVGLIRKSIVSCMGLLSGVYRFARCTRACSPGSGACRLPWVRHLSVEKSSDRAKPLSAGLTLVCGSHFRQRDRPFTKRHAAPAPARHVRATTTVPVRVGCAPADCAGRVPTARAPSANARR